MPNVDYGTRICFKADISQKLCTKYPKRYLEFEVLMRIQRSE
jgi:hypothetical protein